MYYLPTCSENKGADQLHCYRIADLHLCFRMFSHDSCKCVPKKSCKPYVMYGLSNYYHLAEFTFNSRGLGVIFSSPEPKAHR